MNFHNAGSDCDSIQRGYPQIYLTCHVRHIRAASTRHRLSSGDSSLLVHLNPNDPVTPGDLAAHMGVRPSTLSAAIQRLAKLGYLLRQQAAGDRRVAALTITPQGTEAMAATSVLDRERLERVLAKLTRSQRARAAEGVELLAKACRQVDRESVKSRTRPDRGGK
jgi:DNA-binding MarR family transcriptional regulator